MAQIIKTDGSITEVIPKNGKAFNMDEIRGYVECEWLEMVSIPNKFLFLDEEGKLKPHTKNVMADFFFGKHLSNSDYFAGHVMVLSKDELMEMERRYEQDEDLK